jgi:glutamate-5-semialdehyde dehydrogenase
MTDRLERLEAGMAIPYGGDRLTTVPRELADAFVPGDRLVVVQDTGALLHITAADWAAASGAVERAHTAFARMGTVSDGRISAFYRAFADRLADDDAFEAVDAANRADVEAARERGRTTTRLVLTARMRRDMIAGLRGWADRRGGRGEIVETVEHPGWRAELVRAGLGVVGFVFEGRPNVFADATGVLRAGNTVVFRIGSDALGTARAIVATALEPALAVAGLPEGAATLVDAAGRAAGWAMFSDPRLSLAVARGSGTAVAQLGAVARQAGIPVSLHGTGGAWIVVSPVADPIDVGTAVYHSLDRKVCNTLNTICVAKPAAETHVPAVLAGLRRAAERRGSNPKLHYITGQAGLIPPTWFEVTAISRAGGLVHEPGAEELGWGDLGREWEWEDSPEVTLAVVDDTDRAIELFNGTSPKFAASLVSPDGDEQRHFFEAIDSPFVGNGFTRWVDGQYALDRPELGLSNWQFGRLFGRGGVLSGDSVFTIRTRAVQDVLDIGR